MNNDEMEVKDAIGLAEKVSSRLGSRPHGQNYVKNGGSGRHEPRQGTPVIGLKSERI